MLLFVAVGLVGFGAPDFEAFALKVAPAYVDDILKSPTTAKYAVKAVKRRDPSSVLVPGRYMVTGHVDAADAFGTPVRAEWAAVVRDDGGKPVLLALVYVEGGSTQTLYVAPASRRFRKEVIARVKADFAAASAKYRKRLGSVPRSKRSLFLNRYTDEFIRGGKAKYGLDATQMLAIIGDAGGTSE